jgi:hypothetical protein
MTLPVHLPGEVAAVLEAEAGRNTHQLRAEAAAWRDEQPG